MLRLNPSREKNEWENPEPVTSVEALDESDLRSAGRTRPVSRTKLLGLEFCSGTWKSVQWSDFGLIKSPFSLGRSGQRLFPSTISLPQRPLSTAPNHDQSSFLGYSGFIRLDFERKSYLGWWFNNRAKNYLRFEIFLYSLVVIFSSFLIRATNLLP